ncbi:hypothetical protein BaRGS_00014031 [Batillaria attramentaria]|uniref:Uncharacterized protein n=1 Tax=Batillaria attramentaria TaxID=370345 RepID=A0ABD0L511_9CAEN
MFLLAGLREQPICFVSLKGTSMQRKWKQPVRSTATREREAGANAMMRVPIYRTVGIRDLPTLTTLRQWRFRPFCRHRDLWFYVHTNVRDAPQKQCHYCSWEA